MNIMPRDRFLRINEVVRAWTHYALHHSLTHMSLMAAR